MKKVSLALRQRAMQGFDLPCRVSYAYNSITDSMTMLVTTRDVWGEKHYTEVELKLNSRVIVALAELADEIIDVEKKSKSGITARIRNFTVGMPKPVIKRSRTRSAAR